jgi:hypothetical protein
LNGQSLGAALSTSSDAGADPGKKHDPCHDDPDREELGNERLPYELKRKSSSHKASASVAVRKVSMQDATTA